MGQLPSLILAANPMQEGQLAREPHRTVAHMAYRVEPGPRLMRLSRTMPGQGGLLYCPVEAGRGTGRMDSFCAQLIRECSARRYQGVVADLGEENTALARQLDRTLSQQGLELYVPERYQSDCPHARILISTAISGGTLRGRLAEALRRLGPERAVAALERVAEDFLPPARTGSGTPLSPQALQQLRERIRPSVYWSPELCARYFTYFQPGGTAHFVLFDDVETLRAKLRLAGEVGIRQCLAAWDDLRAAPAGQ